MKKLICAICALFFVFAVCSCVVPTPTPTDPSQELKECNITFVTQYGTIENIKYQEGTSLVLPTPTLSTEEAKFHEFVGWYTNENYTGNMYVEITESDRGDKTFYALFKDYDPMPPVFTDEALADFNKILANLSNYSYCYSLSYTGPESGSWVDVYYYANDIIKYDYQYDGENYTDYLVYDKDSDSYSIITSDDGITYYEMKETDEWFDYYISSFSSIDLSAIKEEDFTYDSESKLYTCKESALQAACDAFLCGTYEGETYSSFTFNCQDGLIKELKITSVCVDNDGTWNYDYNILVSEYGKVSFTLPEYEETPVIGTENSIEAVYAGADGESFTVEGVITGFIGNNFYIQDPFDQSYGLYIYVGQTATTFNVGDYISVTGVKDTYRGLVELKNVTTQLLEEDTNAYALATISSLESLSDYVTLPVNVYQLTVVSTLSDPNPSTSKDVSIKVSDGTYEYPLFISKHLPLELKVEWYKVLASLQVGDKLNVMHAIVSCFDTPQISLCNMSTVVNPNNVVIPEPNPIVPGGEIDINKVAQNLDNYAYSYKVDYMGPENGGWNDVFLYMDGSIKYTYDYEGETYTDYLMYDSATDSFTLYTSMDNVSYLAIPESDPYFDLYLQSFCFIDLSNLDINDFTYTDGVYECKEGALYVECDNVLCGSYEGETYTSFKFTCKDGLIDKIYITSVATDSEGTWSYTYEIGVYDYGKVSFTAPDAEELPGYDAIEDIYAGAENEVYSVCGYVAGFIGNSFYLTEGDKGVYVYCGKTAYEVLVGQYVTVTGTKTVYNGLVELTDLQGVTVLDETISEVTPLTLTSFQNFDSYQGSLVTFNSLTVVTTLTSLTPSTSSDASLTVSDGSETRTLFISKYVPLDVKTTWYEVLSALKVGDVIKVESAVVGCHNTCQLSLLNTSLVSFGFDPNTPVEQTGIKANKDVINVVNGTTLESAMELVEVFKLFNNGTKETLAKTEWTYACANYEPYNDGEYVVTITSGAYSTTITVKVLPESPDAYKPALGELPILENLVTDNSLTRGLKGTGDGKALIVPIAFTDYKAAPDMKSNLQKAFFGTSADTGWESLQSYYLKSSYGKLNITGDVLDPYQTNKSSTYFNNLYKTNDVDAVCEMIKGILDYYDPTVNFAEYDSDGDTYIDALYLIYTAPIDYSSDDSLWWAFTYEYYTNEAEPYDGVEPDFYFFAGYDFLFESTASNKELLLNTETFIHETGHILGISDYYDYDPSVGPVGGLGGGDMMDFNVGDHNPLTKILLGWTTPWVVFGKDFTTDLNSFGTSGDCIIVPLTWNDSYFTEFFVIDFYTPDGLNALEAGYSGLFSISGVRVYHVDCTLATEITHVWDVFKFNNGTTAHKNITLVQATGVNTIDKDKNTTNADLFQAGTTLVKPKWYNNTQSNFTLTINSIDGNSKANVTISFN